MNKTIEKQLLILTDFLSISLAFFVWAHLRQELGFFSDINFLISFIVFLYWFVIFTFFGLYRSWYAQSRIDEIITLVKTITIGIFIIFLVTFEPESDLSHPPTLSRMFILNFWILLILFVGVNRGIFRTVQRKLLISGIGMRRTLIVGWGKKSWQLYDELLKYPALGYQVVGFVGAQKSTGKKINAYKNVPLLDTIENINTVIQNVKAQEVIFSLDGGSQKLVMDLINECNGLTVNFKIVPDLYEIVLGQARINQIYGFPLIDILPHFMPPWEQKIKRFMDIFISLIILVAFLPLWIILAVAIKIESPGPIFYKQKRVGKNGKEFTMYKFRSMVKNAESQSGPKWAEPEDPRITRIGRLIRKPRLDEVPQFINVLKGEMSLIGPRPERPHFVEQLKHKIPFYARRLKVQPGITGWAQIKGEYDTSIENVKTKLQYDLFYLENMSLRMDLKILLSTIYVMLRGKGM
ncbi:MAG: sugar transferase [bacterium]